MKDIHWRASSSRRRKALNSAKVWQGQAGSETGVAAAGASSSSSSSSRSSSRSSRRRRSSSTVAL